MEPLQYEARGYLKEPFRLFHLADGRGEYIEYHYHTFHKIIILLAGRAGYAVEGERYELAPGAFVLSQLIISTVHIDQGISCWWAAGASIVRWWKRGIIMRG